jgi:DNA-binding winged helix-turn-helix (wHTH) protein
MSREEPAVTTVKYKGDVKLLRWPAEAAQRERYRALGVLRLLVVEGGVPAPISSDVREDWVRAPITDDDLRVRIATLRAKAEAHRLPQVHPHGVLRFGGQTITVSRTETDLLECLVRQFGMPVPREMLQECLPDRPGGSSRNALDLHIMRVRKRIAPLGLAIRTVWGLGYLLEATGTESATTGGSRPWLRSQRPDGRGRAPYQDEFDADGRPLPASEVAALRWSRGPHRQAAS